MKKLFASIAVSCLFFTGIYAQKIAITSGKIDFLKNESALTVKFTYENLQVGSMPEADYIEKKANDYNAKESGKGDAWRKAWTDDRAARYEPHFIEFFNKYISEKTGANITEETGNK
jgi:hypothetical protein